MKQGLLSSQNINLYHHLDWDHFVSLLHTNTYFDSNKEIFSAPVVRKTATVIAEELDLLDFFILNLDNIHNIFMKRASFLPEESKIYEFIDILSKRPILDMKQVNICANLFELVNDLYRFLEKSLLSLPDKGQFYHIHRNFISPLRAFVASDGVISFDKHPLLRPLFTEIGQIEDSLRTTVQQILSSEAYNSHLQYDTYDIINEHFVIPIRSDSYRLDMGQIISKSSSGSTLHVEPPQIKSLCNRRVQLLAKIDEVIQKICLTFSDLISSFASTIQDCFELSLAVDLYLAKAILSNRFHFVRPEISHDFSFQIDDFFHPLIKNPIKNSIVLTSDNLGLIISGPNTGGKTVALKSIAYCNILLHMGLYIPAKSAKLSPSSEIYFFGHDSQNLSQGLSSFSSEARNYLCMISELEDNSLVFIDEIFNSTSSEDASALTLALLQEIHAISPSSKVFITTHHSYLKTFIHDSEDYLSAHVSTERDGHTPSYKLIYGTPGSSLALPIFDEMAHKLNIKSNISRIAKKYLSSQQVSYENILSDLSKKQSFLDDLISENEMIRLKLLAKEKEVKGTLFLEKEKMLQLYENKLNNVLNRATSLYDDLKRGAAPSKHNFFAQISHLKSEILLHPDPQPTSSLKTTSLLDLSKIKRGDVVFCTLLDKHAKVLDVNMRKKSVQISTNGKSLWVKSQELSPSEAKHLSAPKVIINTPISTSLDLELDLRGLRHDEFLSRSSHAISELKMGNIPFLTIIHGHGDGVLKRALRELADKDNEINWEAEEGNDGATKISLKN